MSIRTDTDRTSRHKAATGFKAATGAVVFALAAAACSGTATTAPTAPSQPSVGSQAPTAGAPASTTQPEAGTAVSIVNFAFNPASITVAAGAAVTWTNTSGSSHTVTADDGSFDSSKEGAKTPIAGGGTYSHTFATAGTFTYKCTIHSSMVGTVVVTP